MSPTHTISAHLCKQIYTSWKETRQPQTAMDTTYVSTAPYPARRSPSPEKRSMDSDRSDSSSPPMSRSSSSSSWKWGSR
ncbi:hypothetical protein TruAng_003938 [Truncatella angustata]|nr:hypothetical protein TruAng_003938 [Truncatella angustata]